MFSAKEKTSSIQYDTLISSKTEINGDINFVGGLHVDGVVKGNLTAEEGSGATVRISDKGKVEGEIQAPNIIVNGDVVGDVHASEYVELAKNANVTGDVYYKMMEMVLGAVVNGQLHQSKDGQPKPKLLTQSRSEAD
jgi:cytoskeletal protein CcmA (bactofilin family)